MPRKDITDYLVHWTKGDNDDKAFEAFRGIVFSHRLFGGAGNIRGGFECVCFTEAPIDEFHQVFTKYKPFGIRVSKKWLFARGGRPAVYQSDAEYDLLPDELKWRHVRYEPDGEPPIDFSWEREWRIHARELELPPQEIVLVLPDDKWADLLEREHLAEEEARIQMESVAYGEWAAYQSPERFRYTYAIVDV